MSRQFAFNWRFLGGVLDGLASAAMIVVAGVVIWGHFANRSPAKVTPERPVIAVPAEPVILWDTPTKGHPTAKVVIIEYADFECSFCAAFASQTLPILEHKYISTGKVLFAFRHLPLTSIHPTALETAQASECAKDQNRFWEMHDALFMSPTGTDRASLEELARSVKLQPEEFRRCMAGTQSTRLREDMEEATRFGIVGTPTFLFGTIDADGHARIQRIETGALTLNRVGSLIEELLQMQ